MFKFLNKKKKNNKKSELEKYRLSYRRVPLRIFGMTPANFKKAVRS